MIQSFYSKYLIKRVKFYVDISADQNVLDSDKLLWHCESVKEQKYQ